MSRNYVVMKVLRQVKVLNMQVEVEDKSIGLIGFIPVFETEKQAKAWGKNDDTVHAVEVEGK
jgi:hypothetical protein